jgi:hypothetical protein
MNAYPIIQLSFCHRIQAGNPGEFETGIRQATFREFLLKSQAYNTEGKYKRFTEMTEADGRANSLHYKTGFVAGPWMQKYRNQLPVWKDHAGKTIPFVNHRVELIESHIDDFSQHEISIHFQTGPYAWLATLGNALVLSSENSRPDAEGFINCFTISMQSNLSVIRISHVSAGNVSDHLEERELFNPETSLRRY